MDEYIHPFEKEKKQNVENFYHDGNIETIYRWLDKIPFSKPPKTLARDFADGFLMAELLKLYYPRLLEIHNCIPASNVNMRKDNWSTLNRKVFSKINLKLNNNTISQLANCHHGTIEKLLLALLAKLTNKDVNYLQETVQELEEEDISQTKIENIEEIIEEAPEIKSVKPTALETEPKSFSFLLNKTKNSLKVMIISLLNFFCFWKWFGKLQALQEKPHTEIACNNTNNYPFEISRETAYINEQIHESATRWAYEQLIQEIHEKEDVITTLNHKVAYLEGTMRQKDLRIANLMSQVTNSSVEILPNSRQRIFSSSQVKLRPKSHNPLMMPSSFGS